MTPLLLLTVALSGDFYARRTPVRAPVTTFVLDNADCRIHEPWPSLPGDAADEVHDRFAETLTWGDSPYERAAAAGECCSLRRAGFIGWVRVHEDPAAWAPLCGYGLPPGLPRLWRERQQLARYDARTRAEMSKRAWDPASNNAGFLSAARPDGASCASLPTDPALAAWCAEVCAPTGGIVSTCRYETHFGSWCISDVRCRR